MPKNKNPKKLNVCNKTMDPLKKKGSLNMSPTQTCNNPRCFFCMTQESDPSIRRAAISKCFKEMTLKEDEEHVLVLSGLWNIAMAQPDDPEFISLGVFECMAKLINKGVHNGSWLFEHQNIYIPYYAAHIIGSYTMNKAEFAEKAVKSGVIPPLMELLKGKISWVEQRVAVRALGHLASYGRTFEAVAEYQEEAVRSTMELASTCLETVYTNFVAVKDQSKRIKYHCDLLTRGVGGVEMENRKAEEWAGQLQCWSIYLLNCFACKERALEIICKQEFLRQLCGIWGGLVNHSSPAGVGLIRILCYSKEGRRGISETREVLENLCNLSRSSDDWQYIGIDCFLFLLKDPDTRNRVLEVAAGFLVDLVELKNLGERPSLGDSITKVLLSDYKQRNFRLKNEESTKILREIWELRVGRRKREKLLSEEKVEEMRVLVGLIKQQAKNMFWREDIESAVRVYSEALELCPLRLRKERMVIYSNRAQCCLLLGDPDKAIHDSTRALCLANPANSHGKSLWRRSQAYDMKGLARESLMDCIMFVNGCMTSSASSKKFKIPYYAAKMISKQMDATWLFGDSRLESLLVEEELDGSRKRETFSKISATGLPTVIEEPMDIRRRRRKVIDAGNRRRKSKVFVSSTF